MYRNLLQRQTCETLLYYGFRSDAAGAVCTGVGAHVYNQLPPIDIDCEQLCFVDVELDETGPPPPRSASAVYNLTTAIHVMCMWFLLIVQKQNQNVG